MKREKWPIACLLPGDKHEMKSPLLDLILLDSREELDKLAAENNWCRASELTEKFYEYLDEGALDCEDFGDVLRDLLPNEPMRRVDRYTFGDKRQGTFSPGNLEPHMQQALAIAENARRGICTEVPPEFGAYWRSLPHSIPWWMTMVADRESVCEFWNNPDEFPRVPRDGSPHPKIPNETVNLVRINAQKSPLQNILPDLYNLRKSNTLKSRTPIRESKLSDLVHGTKFDPDAEPDRLLAALQAALPGRRCGFAGRTHHTPLDCYEACGLYDSEDPKYGWYGHLREHHLKHLLQTAGENCACDSPRTPVQPYGWLAGWKITNRMHSPPTDNYLESARNAALLYLVQDSYGDVWWESTSTVNEPQYWDLLQSILEGFSAAEHIWALVIGKEHALAIPENDLQHRCYGFCIDTAAKTMELTEGPEALGMLRLAAQTVFPGTQKGKRREMDDCATHT